MPQIAANFAKALLVGTITPSDTELTIESSRADLFPVGTTVSWGSELNWFKLVLQDTLNNHEIVYAGVRTGGSSVISNLLRAREGTTARTWTATETIVANRPTAKDFADAFSALMDGGTVSTNSQNFNTLVQRKIHLLTGDGSWTGASNSPTLAPANGILTVYATGDGVLQELVTHTPHTVWHRIRTTASNWGTWKRADAYEASTFIRTLMDDASAEAARTTLGAAALAGSATQRFSVQAAVDNAHAVRLDQMNAAGLIYAPVATVVPMLRVTTPAGWVALRGGFIGDAASGANERANADTKALFEELWAATDNSDFPVRDSTGALVARGTSASADFAAHKRFPLMDMRFEYIQGWDDGRGGEPGRRRGSWRAGALLNHRHRDVVFDAVGEDTGNGRSIGGSAVVSGEWQAGNYAIGANTGYVIGDVPIGGENLVRGYALPHFQKL